MVNRVLKNLGQSDVAAFNTSDRSALALEHVNQAARSLFEEQSWDWLLRHDGALRLRPSHSGEIFTLTNVTTAPDSVSVAQVGFQVGTATSDYVFSNVGAYFIFDDDTKWSNMSSKIQGGFDGAGAPPSITSCLLTHEWHSNILIPVDNDMRIIFPEYILPTNVRTVSSARYQQEEVTIRFIDPDTTFDRLVPAPHVEEGPPEVIMVGGQSVHTITNFSSTTLGSPPTPSLRAFVWPIPDDDYLLNYSYVIKPDALAELTDTFPGVPESAIDRIVDDATAEMMLMIPTSDPTLGELNRRSSLQKRERVLSQHRPDKGRRFSMRSLDRQGRGRNRLVKRTYGSLDLDG
jgi:hypothetical protein